MVSPHPDLERKLKNNRRLIRENKGHLIDDFMKKDPFNYLDSKKFDKLERLKPWKEVDEKIRSLDLLSPDRNMDNILILCIDFIDKPASVPISTIYNRFFGAGNTLRSYFNEVSYGQYVPDGNVYGWYRAPQPSTYYTHGEFGIGSYPNNTAKLVEDALNLAINDISADLPFFDANNNKNIEYLIIVHSGAEAAKTGNPDDFWAHIYTYLSVMLEGYEFKQYICVSEYPALPSDSQMCGVDCHELAHIMGLPDLFDITGKSSGAGYYSLMGVGPWANGGYTPTHLDAWSKYVLGYVTILNDVTGQISLGNIENYSSAIRYNTLSMDYYLVENRQRIGFDQYLPAEGLLIWKINDLQKSNTNPSCYHVGLVQGDGLYDLENGKNYGDAGDSFPGSTFNRRFSKNTIPDTVLCDGSYYDFIIDNISDSDDIMTFNTRLVLPCVIPSCEIVMEVV